MTTKDLSIPDLCKLLGLTLREPKFFMEENTLFCYSKMATGTVCRTKILSINDKFPTDICKCGHTREHHIANGLGFCCMWKCRYPNGCNEFKPHLATVKGIKLTERCECRHDKEEHSKKLGCLAGFNARISEVAKGIALYVEEPKDECPCKQFKPVQMVEITKEG